MAEYIEREEALAECDWYANEFCEAEYAIMPIRGAIRNIPTADVQPVRHGRWIWDNDAIDWGLGAWVCSECHGRNENIHAGKPGYDHTIGMSPYSWAGSAYCPNCGALMKENSDVPTTD